MGQISDIPPFLCLRAWAQLLTADWFQTESRKAHAFSIAEILSFVPVFKDLDR